MLASEDDDSTTSAFDRAFVVQRKQERPADLTASETDDHRKLERHISSTATTSGRKTEKATSSDGGIMGGRDGSGKPSGRPVRREALSDDDGRDERKLRSSRAREADDRTNLYGSSSHHDDSHGSTTGSEEDGSASRGPGDSADGDGLASLADLTSYGNSVGSSAGSGVPILHPHHKKRRDRGGRGKYSDRESDVEMQSSRDRRSSSRTKSRGTRRRHYEDDYEAAPPHHNAPPSSRGRSGRHDRLPRTSRRVRRPSAGGFDYRDPLGSAIAAANSFAEGLNFKTVAMCVLGMFAVVKMANGPPPPPNAMHGVSSGLAASDAGSVRGALVEVPREEVKEQESLDNLMKEKDDGDEGEAGDNEENVEAEAEVKVEEEQEADMPAQSDPIQSALSGGGIMDAGAASPLSPVQPGGVQQYPAQMAFQQAFPQQQMYAPAQGIMMQPQMMTPQQQQMMMGGFAQPMQPQPGMMAQGGYAMQPGFVPMDWQQQQQQAAQYASAGGVPPPPPPPEGEPPEGMTPEVAAEADPQPPPPALPQQVPPEEPSTADPEGSVPLAAPEPSEGTGDAQSSESVLHLLDNFKDAWEPVSLELSSVAFVLGVTDANSSRSARLLFSFLQYAPTDIPMFWRELLSFHGPMFFLIQHQTHPTTFDFRRHTQGRRIVHQGLHGRLPPLRPGDRVRRHRRPRGGHRGRHSLPRRSRRG